MARIVVVGSYGVGLTMTLDRAPRAGETVHGRTFSSAHGGKGSNQAVGAARLGASVTLLTAVGQDGYAAAARRLWEQEGVDDHLVRSLPGSTMVGVILVDGEGENRIALAAGVLADFGPEQLEGLAEALEGADLLVVGLEIPLATAHEALRVARDVGVPTLLNPAPAPVTALPAGLLDLVDHLTPNRSEAAALAGLAPTADPQDLLDAEVFAAVPNLLLTLGGHGVLMRSEGTVTQVAGHRVPVVDTTGAGDCFTAAYAVRVAEGGSALQACRYACRAAALSVGTELVIPSLPRAADLQRHESDEPERTR